MVSATDIQDGFPFQPVQQICKRVIGKRVAPSTLFRWVRKGTKGGKLEAVHINGTWHCTAEQFADFINRQTAAKLADAADNSDDESSASDDALRAEGLL